jgi:16S rRNA (adenine1518-N6/adenine1519-N6)-dimethyltransferase
LRPRKRLGQNFLVDVSAARRIAALATHDAGRVLEIGAGTGTLTAALAAAGAAVTALEIDEALVEILRERDDLAAATIVHADALAYDYAAYGGDQPWHVAGNLPYNIATPLVTRLVEMERGPQSLVVMVQSDVAERFAAAPGTAAYGSLSVAVQYAANVRRAFTLGPRAFYPAPKVDSTVVVITRRAQPAAAPNDVALFREVVRAAFAYRRKRLVNSLVLALGLPRTRVERAVAQAGIPMEQRGERLDINEFAKLADALAER